MTENNLIAVGRIGELPIGTVCRVSRPGGAPLAIYHTEEGFFATEDTCTHGIASLSEGTLEGGVIECPFHGGAFDVRTGRAVSEPCTMPLQTFEVVVRGDAVYVVAPRAAIKMGRAALSPAAAP